MINVDVTYETEQHIHRIGRTGRAGEEGLALNLASMDEMGRVGKIELLQRRETEWHKLTELDAGSDKPLVAPMVTLQILGGRKEKIRPGDVLGALTKDMGFRRRADRQDQRDRDVDLRGGRTRDRGQGVVEAERGAREGQARAGAADRRHHRVRLTRRR